MHRQTIYLKHGRTASSRRGGSWSFVVLSLGLMSSAEAAIIAPAAANAVAGQTVKIPLVNAGEMFSILESPAHGTLTTNSDGSVSYTANSDYTGSDRFRFSADLGDDASVTGTGSVSLNVVAAPQNNDPAANENQALSALEQSTDPGLQEFYRNLSLLPAATQAQVIQSITPLQTAAQINSAANQSSGQARNISQRLREIHTQTAQGGSTGGIKISANGQSLTHGHSAGGGAGDETQTNDLLDDRLGIYINGQFSRGDRITTDREVGSNSDIFGVTLGMDYRLTDQFVLGTAFGFTDNDTEYERGAGQLKNRGYSGSLYGSYNVTDNLYLDGVFTYTSNDYESERMLLIPDAQRNLNIQNSKATPGGDQQRVSLGAGYDIPMGPWTVGLRARAEYGSMTINAYRETGPSALNLQVDEQFNESMITVLGWQVGYAYSTPFGVLLPQLNLDWEHEFMNDSRNMVMRYVNDTTLPFTIKTNNPDRDYLTLRAGMSAVFANGLSSFIQYETLLDQRYDTLHTARIGVRWEF